MSGLFERIVERTGGMKADSAFSELGARQNFGFKTICDPHLLSRSHLPAGTHQRLPRQVIFRDGPEQEDFDTAGEMLAALGIVGADGHCMDTGAGSEEARGYYLRIVQDQAIAVTQ